MFIRSGILKSALAAIQYGMLVALTLTGCSGNFGLSRKGSDRLHVPAGVDSTVAAEADSSADHLFVSIEREQKSDSYKALGKQHSARSDTLWKFLENDPADSLEVAGDDSLRAIEAFNDGARSLQALAALEQNPDGLSEELLKAKALQQLQIARHNLEKSVVLNPFDLETRSWLGRVYQALAVRFLDEENHKKAANVLESLVRLERGEHTLFARLAEAYYALEEWPAAHHHFQNAERVLKEAHGLDFSGNDFITEAGVDTAALFYYVYYQGDTELKMHDAESGLASLNRALQYASSPKEREDILSYITWVNWDDGNTRGVEARDKYIAMQGEGDHKGAAKGFDKLLSNLRTQRAKDEISWRLAVLEFQNLDKTEQGIERLLDVVKRAPKTPEGAPMDSTYRAYFNSYGVMCHNLGLENIKKNRKVAFTYFKQAVAIEWENRAKSYLELAKLSRNNARAVLESAAQALESAQQLSGEELMQTYQLLVEAYKRSGQFDKARIYYNQWVQMRRDSRRSASR